VSLNDSNSWDEAAVDWLDKGRVGDHAEIPPAWGSSDRVG